MTQLPKGPGALSLLLRLSMLRARQRGAGSLAERGYSLAVALIAAFVLLLGVGALASRGQLGFIGQAFQVQNRQARDVAESAIADFADVMNREPNRHVLVSGTANKTDWLQTDRDEPNSLNICTAYNPDGTKNTDASGDPIILPPDEDEVVRFLPGAVTALPNGRSFEVESVEYRLPDRDFFDRSTTFLDANGDTLNLRDSLILPGRTRTLVRITVVGRVDQNGRTSSARVSREFEIVPKCCNRSFGRNQAGGLNNWGRDQRDCFGGGDVPGLLVGLGGAGPGGGQPGTYVGGKGPLNNVVQEDGSEVADISCLEGANASCTEDGYEIGTGKPIERISVNPFAGPLPQPPEYNNIYDPGMGHTSISFSSRSIVYFDPALAAEASDPTSKYASLDPEDRPSGLVRDGLSGSNVLQGSPTRLNGKALDDPSIDICYQDTKFNAASNDPYTIVHCRAQNFVVSDDVVIDTSAARINFFFDDPGFSGDYLSLSGNTAVIRTHDFRTAADFGTQGVNCLPGSTLANCQIRWPTGTPISEATREETFLELCSYRLTGCDDEKYAVRNLLNFYTGEGTGQFKYNGTADAEGYNIYSTKGSVIFQGTTSFMGQIWTDRFYINGNSTVYTYESSDGKAATGFGVPLFDFIARSFTQSSGF